MDGRVVLFVFSFILSIIGSHGSGEMLVMNSPYALQFSASSKTQQSFLKEVFSASLGLSVSQKSDWDGLAVIDPFNTPRAAVEVYVEGFDKLDLPLKIKMPKLAMSSDIYEPDTFDVMKHRINQRFKNDGNILANIDLAAVTEGETKTAIGDLKLKKVGKQALMHLKPSAEEDYQFLAEIEALKAITYQINSGTLRADNAIDFYYIKMSSLHALADFHGMNSMQTKEAKKILAGALQELNRAFTKAYEGSVLVTVVSTDVAHKRRVIRDLRVFTEGGTVNLTPSGFYSDYPAIFNIILWFVVAFVFSMVAIVYTIVDMDPGRDSIIYRMTSTRLKKE